MFFERRYLSELDKKLFSDILTNRDVKAIKNLTGYLTGEQPVRTGWFACFFIAGSSLKTE